MSGGQWGQWAKVLFAIGLFDAGLLGALCISLATSWALGEVFGWAHSLNRGVREAPWFYVAYRADDSGFRWPPDRSRKRRSTALLEQSDDHHPR